MAKENQAELKATTTDAEPAPKPVVHAPQSQVQSSCHDVFFAALFLIAFGFTIALALMYGDDVLSTSSGQESVTNAETLLREKHAKYKYALKICAGIAGGALLASMLWTILMLVCGKMLIWISVVGVCTVSVGTGLASSNFLKQQGDSMYWWPAAVGSLFAVLVLLYVCCIRQRIAFASANLQVACKAVLNHPMTLLIAVAFTVLQIAWALVWIIATYAAITHGEYVGQGEGYGAGKKFGILTGMVLIFFWATFVLRNIVMVATAGTVSSWWHHAAQDRVPLTTARALGRALTLSFGSICFGSLIVSIVQTIRFVLSSIQHALSRSGNSVAACLVGCINCLVGCIQSWIEYFNRFAYAYVGIYGYSFVSSGKRVYQLFASKGWTAIANDSLIANVLFCGKIVVGFLGAAAAWAVVAYGDAQWTVNVSHPKTSLGISGFLIGYSVVDVIMSVIDGAVATVFILFAEDPHSLALSHTEAHESLHSAWKEMYPEEYENATKRHEESV
ncbi:Pns1-like protein, partial [Globisporangium splendens]